MKATGSLQKRCCERFKMKDGAMALLNCAIPFHIIDISAHGLAFRYVGLEKWFSDPAQIDIVYDDFCLKNLMVQTVSDFQISNGFIQTRRHSLVFGKLSASQVAKLKEFMMKYATQDGKRLN